MNVARFIWEKVVNLLKLESNNIIDKYGQHKQINQQWQNIASTRTIFLNYRIHNFFLQEPDTWTDSSGKLLTWKRTHTT